MNTKILKIELLFIIKKIMKYYIIVTIMKYMDMKL